MVPTFISDWESIPNNIVEPRIGEAQGMLMGSDLVITGGFTTNVYTGTTRTTAMDLSNPNAVWRELASNPIEFWTHGGHATKGDNIMYICGGYLGPHPGDDFADCYMFNKSVDNGFGEWIPLPSLPEGRAGGALLYIESIDSLLFTLGATRGSWTVDHLTTWMLDLNDLDSGWIEKGPAPYQGNHVSAITAYDCTTKGNNARYYVLGGQEQEMEWNGNIDLVYEYIPEADTFIQRASMIEPKGHFTTAIAAYGCGFIIVGGAINADGGDSTSDIQYYSIEDDTWTTIGSYFAPMKTMVCAIYNDELTCSTGYTDAGWKRKLSFPALPTLSPQPTTIAPASQPTTPIPTSPPTPDDGISTLLESTFDNDMDGFTYVDDAFNLGHDGDGANYASGTYETSGGSPGGGLYLKLGGRNSKDIDTGMSGGFVTTFSVPSTGYVNLTFSYKFIFSVEYEDDEYSELLCMVNGQFISSSPSDGSNARYVYYSDPNIGGTTAGWVTVSLDIGNNDIMEQGTYELILGGHNNKKTHGNEITQIYFDNVLLTFEEASFPDDESLLLAGDVAIVQYNADKKDNFAFVALALIPIDTEILFTDRGWLRDTGGFRDIDESVLKWIATEPVFPGTVVTIIPKKPKKVTTGTVINLEGGKLNLNGWGDQLIVYQEKTSSSDPSSLYNLIFAINNQDNGVWQWSAGSSGNSGEPPNTILPSNCKIALNEIDNIAYQGSTITGTKEQLLGAITNKNNWFNGSNKNTEHKITTGPFTVLV